MRSLITTALIAAVGASIAVASPALAKSRRAVDTVQPVYGAQVSGFQPAPGVVEQAPQSPLFAAPHVWGDAQIRNEYIKDDTIHNGNAY